MKLASTLFAALSVVAAAATNSTQPAVGSNGCVTFSVSAGTGCAWMCSYCANSLGTNNYYFTTDVCTYQQGVGCLGNPLAGVPYTCCAAASSEVEEEVLEAEDVFGDGAEEGGDDDCDDETAASSTSEWDVEITEIRITELRRRRA